MSRCLDRRELAVTSARLFDELTRQRQELERLCEENEILRAAAEPLIDRAPACERFMFNCHLRGRFSVKRLCRVLVTDRGNFYAWVRAQACRERCERDVRVLIDLIAEIHAMYPAYGAGRVARGLQWQGVEVGCRQVTRLMREHGIAGTSRRKRRKLTRPDTDAGAVPELIRREFTAPMPGLKLIGDTNCFPTSTRDATGSVSSSCAGFWWLAAPTTVPGCAGSRSAGTMRRKTGTWFG